jgi:hypothetical protein
MTLDDLQQRWQETNAKLDAALVLHAALARPAVLNGTRTALERAARSVLFEWLATLVAVMVLGAFAADHVRERPVLLCAALLDAYGIAATAAGIAAFVRLRAIDYDAPLLAVARAVERIALLRAWTVFWTLTVAPLMWMPLLVVALRAAFGPLAVDSLSPVWIGANVAFGAAVLAGAIVFARGHDFAAAPSSPADRLWRTLAGGGIRAAAQRLAALSDDAAAEFAR